MKVNFYFFLKKRTKTDPKIGYVIFNVLYNMNLKQKKFFLHHFLRDLKKYIIQIFKTINQFN